MKHRAERCAVCSLASGEGAVFSRVVIEGRSMSLCREHASLVALAMPPTFEEFRKLFAGQGGDRRSPIPRRDPDDRRLFPPRPEGRRMASGRRASDQPSH